MNKLDPAAMPVQSPVDYAPTYVCIVLVHMHDINLLHFYLKFAWICWVWNIGIATDIEEASIIVDTNIPYTDGSIIWNQETEEF